MNQLNSTNKVRELDQQTTNTLSSEQKALLAISYWMTDAVRTLDRSIGLDDIIISPGSVDFTGVSVDQQGVRMGQLPATFYSIVFSKQIPKSWYTAIVSLISKQGISIAQYRPGVSDIIKIGEPLERPPELTELQQRTYIFNPTQLEALERLTENPQFKQSFKVALTAAKQLSESIVQSVNTVKPPGGLLEIDDLFVVPTEQPCTFISENLDPRLRIAIAFTLQELGPNLQSICHSTKAELERQIKLELIGLDLTWLLGRNEILNSSYAIQVDLNKTDVIADLRSGVNKYDTERDDTLQLQLAVDKSSDHTPQFITQLLRERLGNNAAVELTISSEKHLELATFDIKAPDVMNLMFETLFDTDFRIQLYLSEIEHRLAASLAVPDGSIQLAMTSELVTINFTDAKQVDRKQLIEDLAEILAHYFNVKVSSSSEQLVIECSNTYEFIENLQEDLAIANPSEQAITGMVRNHIQQSLNLALQETLTAPPTVLDITGNYGMEFSETRFNQIYEVLIDILQEETGFSMNFGKKGEIWSRPRTWFPDIQNQIKNRIKLGRSLYQAIVENHADFTSKLRAKYSSTLS